MSETQASTKIEDLPDNIKETEELVNDLDHIVTETESEAETERDILVYNSEKDESQETLVDMIPDFVIIFSLFLTTSSPQFSSIVSKIPGLSMYASSGSITLTIISGIVAALLFLAVKQLLKLI